MGVWIEKILCILRLYVLIQGRRLSEPTVSDPLQLGFLVDEIVMIERENLKLVLVNDV